MKIHACDRKIDKSLSVENYILITFSRELLEVVSIQWKGCVK